MSPPNGRPHGSQPSVALGIFRFARPQQYAVFRALGYNCGYISRDLRVLRAEGPRRAHVALLPRLVPIGVTRAVDSEQSGIICKESP
jgi:hypothetical protein